MTIRKRDVLQLVRSLPDRVDLEELIYRLYLRQKIAAGEADIAAGRVLSSAELRKRIKQWRK